MTDFMNIAVKWRQINLKPKDQVWWLDRFSNDNLLEMKGLTTFLISGVSKNYRYYSYYNQTLQCALQSYQINSFQVKKASNVWNENMLPI